MNNGNGLRQFVIGCLLIVDAVQVSGFDEHQRGSALAFNCQTIMKYTEKVLKCFKIKNNSKTQLKFSSTQVSASGKCICYVTSNAMKLDILRPHFSSCKLSKVDKMTDD